MKIFISTTTFAEYNEEPLLLLKDTGLSYSLNHHKRQLTQDEIRKILNENKCEGLIAGTEALTKDVLESAKRLRVISRVGSGISNIDLDAAKYLNIKVFNTPDAATYAVAELTIGLILNCLRKVSLCDRTMRSGIWKKEMGFLFRGKTLGIIGMGRIGQRVAQLASSFGVKIIFFDVRKVKASLGKPVALRGLLEISDIISLHASGRETIISNKEIAWMKDGAILINVGRGGLINEEALYEALTSSKIAYAALDTFVKEPYKGRFLELDNILLTPHIGSYAKEARIEMELTAVKNLIKGLKEEND